MLKSALMKLKLLSCCWLLFVLPCQSLPENISVGLNASSTASLAENLVTSEKAESAFNPPVEKADPGSYTGKKIVYHDSCYLGRGNGIYEAPRKLLEALDAELVEMKRCKSKGLCCGAGGAQMFKEEEKGNTRVNFARTREALETGAGVIASACPFCNTMLTDGVKQEEKESSVKVMDIAELIASELSVTTS